jgi:hypothetical protein
MFHRVSVLLVVVLVWLFAGVVIVSAQDNDHHTDCIDFSGYLCNHVVNSGPNHLHATSVIVHDFNCLSTRCVMQSTFMVTPQGDRHNVSTDHNGDCTHHFTSQRGTWTTGDC